MGQCKKDVIPLLTRWSYIFLALTHRYDGVVSFFVVTQVRYSRPCLFPAMIIVTNFLYSTSFYCTCLQVSKFCDEANKVLNAKKPPADKDVKLKQLHER